MSTPRNDSKEVTSDRFSNIYFVGAGGIGMAALERYYLSRGKNVAGYDRTPTPLTDDLIREGAMISFEDSMGAVPESFRDPSDTLAVYTPAVPADNIPLSFFRDNGFTLFKRARVLGDITRLTKSLCFAGTHGKTTTSSMAAHIMQVAGPGSNAFLGGVLRNYKSNFLLSDTSAYSVLEADEFDRSFHQLTPYIAVITATDPDHLDIYGTEEAYLESFAHFTELIRPDGILLVHKGLKLKPRTAPTVSTYTYSRDAGDFHAANIRRGNGRLLFDFVYPGGVLHDIKLGVPADINIDNAVAALAATWLTGDIDLALAAEAIASFKGAERRFQFHIKDDMPGGLVIIDDYAHHPDEVRQSLLSLKALYPDSKLTVAFQPHLYSRTRDFAPEFAQALSIADDVVLTDLYPARELPIPGVSSALIFNLLTSADKALISPSDLVTTLSSRPLEVVVIMGAGDLYLQIPDLARALGRENDLIPS